MSFDLYPKSRTPALDLEWFRNPPAEYRGAPFWSWNCKLDIEQLLRQIETIQAMGFGGFNIHSRTGLDTEYLGDEFMAAVKRCVDRAAELGVLAWLYDEDRWPSGYAGGLVTMEEKHRVKHLLWTCMPYGAGALRGKTDYTTAVRQENGTLIGRYEVVLEDGRLTNYRKLNEDEKTVPLARVWYAYLETAGPSVWFNGANNVDTMSREAMQKFLEVTHERYKRVVGDQFGKTIPAFFTDEPQFVKKSAFGRADETRDLFMPFTTDFLDSYRDAFKQNLENHLPELFWNLPNDAPSVVRYRYHEHTAERFASAFSDTLGEWCEKNGVALTGHMLGEATLHGQTRGCGEAMRGLRSFNIPGIDMLCDKREYTTAKQAQSIARQFGRAGVMSELYGVTNWDYDFVGHKAQGDWQAALGVTVRVPHLAWVSMAGEAKRDYPAAIGYQSPWFKEYPLIEDHFARVNVVMTRGKPIVRVGVIHPIESSWLTWGPAEQNADATRRLEESFEQITEWLLFGLIDFDYISEGLLSSQSPHVEGNQFVVGAMRYDAIVVPESLTLRDSTLERLERFSGAGGTVIFAANSQIYVDAKIVADRDYTWVGRRARSDRIALLQELRSVRDIEITHADGSPADSLLMQMREDGESRYLFIVNTDRTRGRSTTIAVRGAFVAKSMDTFTGETRPIRAEVKDGWTRFDHRFTPHGHLVATLVGCVSDAPLDSRADAESNANGASETHPAKWIESTRLHDPVRISLAEPNVLLLDYAQWRLNEEEAWQPIEEILRLDNKVRQRLNLPLRTGRAVQPWADRSPALVLASVQLRFAFRSEVDVSFGQLAMENPESTRIELDGVTVRRDIEGWWVDESIKLVNLPGFGAGEHEIVLTIDFTRKTDLEWCYLLGDFGVRLAGRHATITAPVRELAFGDWTRQGLPFYAGNVVYHCKIEGDGAWTKVQVPKFKNPLLSVDLDSKLAGKVAFAPFEIDLGLLPAGEHRLDVTAFGNRANAFGPLHHADENLSWVGPGAWRSTGSAWQDEPVLKRMGILSAPIVLKPQSA